MSTIAHFPPFKLGGALQHPEMGPKIKYCTDMNHVCKDNIVEYLDKWKSLPHHFSTRCSAQLVVRLTKIWYNIEPNPKTRVEKLFQIY